MTVGDYLAQQLDPAHRQAKHPGREREDVVAERYFIMWQPRA
jgi:hypothetical protein